MAATDIRAQVLEFAAAYPLPNVKRAVWLAENGTLTWEQVYNLFGRSLGTALATVQDEA